MSAIVIRKGNADDADAVARLSLELGYASDIADIRHRIASIASSAEDLFVVAIEAGDRPIAWLQAHASHTIESGYRVEIVGLVVTAHARRHGVGRLLVAKAETWAKEKQASAIVVRSNTLRLESHRFYPALGYAESKTQRVYRKQLD